MSTQDHFHRLQAGQALQLPGRVTGPVILVEGEVLVQAPAAWLADTMVLRAPERVVAPAVLDAACAASVIAVRTSRVAYRPAASRVSVAQLRAWAARCLEHVGASLRVKRARAC